MDTKTIQYLASIMPDARIECAGCPGEAEASKMVIRQDQVFCSDSCADVALSVIVKPTVQRNRIDGWDV